MSQNMAAFGDLEGLPLERPQGYRLMAKSLVSNGALMLGLTVAAAICLAAILAPWVSPVDPLTQDLSARLKPPVWTSAGSSVHLLGTDQFGRDVLSRLIYGARYSLTIAITATLIAGVVGTLFAVLAGYVGGRIGTVVMRAADIQLALDAVLLALIVVAVYGPSLLALTLVLAAVGWSNYTRVLYGVVQSLRSQEYVSAARSMGASQRQIIVWHVLSNLIPPVIVLTTLQVARVLLLAAGLSFLGLGVADPQPSWGGMLADGQKYIYSAWWLITLPGVLITITVGSINLMGSGLGRMVDPHSR